ncbi:MAG: hypothetical protein M1823_005107 [Watsoniomyces obsoletus]|nr:MAG: hypothetical protein M1823_005107 [Watsoniomyces obsoletus]
MPGKSANEKQVRQITRRGARQPGSVRVWFRLDLGRRSVDADIRRADQIVGTMATTTFPGYALVKDPGRHLLFPTLVQDIIDLRSAATFPVGQRERTRS